MLSERGYLQHTLVTQEVRERRGPPSSEKLFRRQMAEQDWLVRREISPPGPQLAPVVRLPGPMRLCL